MKTNVKLLKELLKIVYTKGQCDVMLDMATSYEVSVLEGTDDKERYKQKVIEEMMAVHHIALTIPQYRQSEIYFDNNVLNVNLI